MRAHARACNSHVRAALEAAGVATPAQLHGVDHLLCLELGDRSSAIAAGLARQGIVVRPIGAATLRLSFGFWNDLDDLNTLCTALAALLA